MRTLKIQRSFTDRTAVLDIYLREIAKYEILTARQEEQLFFEYVKTKDIQIRDRIVKANLRFVVSVAKQYASAKTALIDMINYGNEGLIEAAERFDPTKGFKFISYAVWWIRQAILTNLAKQEALVRLPQNLVSIRANFNRNVELHFVKTGEVAGFDNVADDLEISEALRKRMASSFYSQQISSLDANIPGSEVKSEDLLGEPDAEDTRSDIAITLQRILNEKELYIVTKFFGIGGEAQSLDKIGAEFGVSGERIRQLYGKIIKKLQRHNSLFLGL